MLHYDSHVDVKCKKSLFLTMLNRVFRLSSSRKVFTEECERLKKTFVRLRYPVTLLENIIMWLIGQQREKDDHPTVEERNVKEDVVRVMLPFKDLKSADSMRLEVDPDEMVRDRVVIGCYSKKVREKLIQEGSELILDKAVVSLEHKKCQTASFKE